MHIVTKILMVFCAILSLLLAALTMSFAANASAIRASVSQEQQRRVAAETALNAAQASQGEQRASSEQKFSSLNDQINSLNAQIGTLQSERTRLTSELERATTDAASIRGQISQAGATIETQAKIIESYRTELSTLRESGLTTQRQAIELSDRVSELEGIREVLDQNVRALKEQLEEARLNAQTAQAGSGGSAGGSVGNMAARTPRELAGPLVRARITEVFPSPAGDTMIVIDEGANRGIREGTSMNVVRGDQYLGSVVITTVEPTRAVGKMSGVVLGAPARDDQVLSRLQ